MSSLSSVSLTTAFSESDCIRLCSTLQKYSKRNYMFELTGAHSNTTGGVTIDALQSGNETRFPNHSKEFESVNCVAQR